MRSRWTRGTIAAAAAMAALCTGAQAEVKKFMNIGGGQLTPFYELVATPPDGWVLEKEASKQNGMQMLVPKGKTFGNAGALIYVKVSHKQKDLELPQFIANSQDRWRKSVPDSKITKLPEVARSNGRAAFQPFQYENPSRPQQAFEYVAFGEDGDKDGNTFTLMVVITGRDRKAIEKAATSYSAFLRAH